MAIRTVVTRGYGNGTFTGTIALVTLRGYSPGVPFAPGSRITVFGAPARTLTAASVSRTCTPGSSSRTFTPADD